MSGIEIRFLGPGDAHVLDDLAPDVFDGSLRPDSTAAVLADPNHVLAVALVGGRVGGMGSAVVITEPERAALLDDARPRRCTEAWLMTEEDNATARAFYRATGGTEQQRPAYITFDLSRSKRDAG